MNAPAYPKTKKSGVEWLGDIPEHWDVRRLKFAVSCNDETLPENTDSETEIEYVDISSVSLAEGITCTETLSFEKAPSRARRKVRDGDTIVSTVRTYLKAIAPIHKPPKNLIVSTGFAVIRPLEIMEPSFLGYFLQSQGFVDSIVANSKGVSYPAINPSELVCIPVSYPENKNEQRAIAEFLDRKTGRIDELIGKKKELIEKLNEQRSALITSAVTGKIPEIGSRKSAVRMKDSGVAWLGEVPEHWIVKKLKYPFRFSKGKDAQKYTAIYVADNPGPYPVYSGQTKDGGIMGRIDTYDYDVDEVLFVTTVGAKAMTPTILHGKFSLSQNCLLMFPEHERIDLRYFHYQLFPIFFAERGSIASQMQDSLRVSDFDKFYAAYPPINEQRIIADFLDEKTGKIDGLIRKTETAIQTLEEYRTALITAAVTGRIDVTKDRRN